MGTSGDLNDWGCLEIQGTVVTNCRNEDIPADGHVKIPEGVTEIAGGSGNSTDMAGFIDGLNDAFKQFEPLFPDGRKTIEGREFDGCTNLASVTIPEGVTEIRDSAFRSCTSLASVSIPASVTLISNHAFYGCTSLASMTIPEGVTEIGKLAFKNCTGLASVVIPRSVRRIGDEAFCGCKGLSIHYTGNEADWGKVSIGDGAFDGAKIIYNWSGNPFSDLFGNSFNSFDDLFQRLGIWGAQQSGGAGAG